MLNTIVKPQRGSPPPVPEHYERDPGNPYVLHLKWVDCKHRQVIKNCNTCPGDTGIPYCEVFSKSIDRASCFGCEVPRVQVPETSALQDSFDPESRSVGALRLENEEH